MLLLLLLVVVVVVAVAEAEGGVHGRRRRRRLVEGRQLLRVGLLVDPAQHPIIQLHAHKKVNQCHTRVCMYVATNGRLLSLTGSWC